MRRTAAVRTRSAPPPAMALGGAPRAPRRPGGLGRAMAAAALGLWLAWAAPAADAAPPASLDEPQFHTVGAAGAIAQGVVSALAQDRTGFLWLGTSAGLLRYDGYRFRPIGPAQAADAAARGHAFIRTLLVARDGAIWWGTESDGLGRYDPATDTSTVYRHRAADPTSVAAGTIRALAEDRDGALWIGTTGHGLDRFDPRSGRFEHHRAAPGPAPADGALSDDRVQSLLVDRRGTLWVGTWSGLLRRSGDATRFEPAPGAALAGRTVTRLYEAADGRIWAGTQQGDLAVIDPAGGDPWVDAAPGPARRNAVYDIVQATVEQIWIGRSEGIEIRDARDGRLLRQVRHAAGQAGSLAGNEVRALLRDHAGWLWVAGYSGGLQRHDPGNTGIRVLRSAALPGGAVADLNVRSVLQRDNGEIWLGLQDGGVVVLDAELNARGALRPDPAQPRGLGAGRVGSLAQTADGSVWVGTDAGLYQLRADRRVQRVHDLGAGRARRMLAARDGTLWVATQSGLFGIDGRTGHAARWQAQGEARALQGDVNALAEAADGTLWIGTESGLFVRPPGATAIQPVASAPDQGLAHPTVLGLLLDRQQRLWIDTPAGLHRLAQWDGRHARIEHTAARHQLPQQSFGANLLEDERGRIWTHLGVFEPDRGRHHPLTAADGVDIGTGWFRAYARLADGRLLFGGSRGLLVVRPQAFDPWGYAPPVVLAALAVDGRPVRASAPLVLQPGQRGVRAEFAALDFTDPARLRYSVQLEGLDNDWTPADASERVATYGNLAPGRYTLRVRGSNRGGVFSPHELALPIEVLPAWWQTGWARAAALVGLGALMLLVVQLRTALLRRRQHELEARVQQRTAALEEVSRALQRKTVELEEASLSDPLTGLRNRRFLTQHIDADTALACRHVEGPSDPAREGDLVFFMIDIDHFKRINDRHGHAAGDAVLVQTSARLREVFRDADHLVRWGGEEFLIVARGTSRDHAAELAERARARVCGTPFALPDGSPVQATCSVGFAAFPLCRALPRALNWSAVVDVADAALYLAKRAGRNQWFGVIEARAASAEALRSRAAQALPPWVDSGELTVVRSV